MKLTSRVASVLPPSLRRAISGALLDFRALPARLADPKRRDEPWQICHNVGGGDYWQIGENIVSDLKKYAGLSPCDSVLDIGCGTGQVAWPLAHFIEPSGYYLGFDVSKRGIQAARRRVSRLRADFDFIAVDVANREYRTSGAIQEDQFRFPSADDCFDLVFATSVFTHMPIASVIRYIMESARVLKPGGTFYFTAYVITDHRREQLANGEGTLAFKPSINGSMVVDPKAPDRAIGHPLEGFLAAIEEAGLLLPEPVRLGTWLGPASYDGGQDLFVARKPPFSLSDEHNDGPPICHSGL